MSMPISLDPTARFELVLSGDKDKSPAPAFQFRYLTGREWMKVATIADSVATSTGGAEALEKIFAVIKVPLVGWSNMGQHDFDAGKLEDIINPDEAKELLEGIMSHIRPSGDDLKNSVSPRASNGN
jgi:hypothetical protein